MAAPTPNQDEVFEALRAFLLDVLPNGVEVVQGEDNRVPEPLADDFVVITPTRRGRLSTNVRSDADCSFTASISGTSMTVTDVELGAIEDGATVWGSGVSAATTVSAQVSGTPGGVGVYTVAPSQNAAEQPMASGGIEVQEAVELSVQLDIHGPSSGDNAQVITQLFRDPYATEFFASYAGGEIAAPLHADDPRQMAFANEQDQVERRWLVDAMLEVKPQIRVPQQFAGAVAADVVSVEATYAP